MVLRNAVLKDFPRIAEIAKQFDLPMPDFKNCLKNTLLVAEEDGKIYAFCYIKMFFEMVFMPDKESSDKKKVKSLKLMNQRAIDESRSFDISQLHAFPITGEFRDILIKHFNYKPCKDQALYLNTNG